MKLPFFDFKKILQKKIKSEVATPCLVYHTTIPQEQGTLVSDKLHNIDPDNFYKQLKYLKKKRTPVFVDELMERINRGKGISDLFSITFDDGYKSVLKFAIPILIELEVPVTLFLNSGFYNKLFWRDGIRLILDNGMEKEFVEWTLERTGVQLPFERNQLYRSTKKNGKSQVVAQTVNDFLIQRAPQLVVAGMNQFFRVDSIPKSPLIMIGNHSKDHLVMSDLTDEEQMEQIGVNQKFLMNTEHSVSNCFSIPFGSVNSFNQSTLDIVKELGYKGILMSSGYRVHDFMNNSVPLKTNGLVLGNRFMPRNTQSLGLIANELI
jgi:peptidoglycan/xylan/chitin deacetylase (PgdA/CDA1 family)